MWHKLIISAISLFSHLWERKRKKSLKKISTSGLMEGEVHKESERESGGYGGGRTLRVR